MAFVKYAHSKVVQPNITFDGWEDVRAKEASFNARTASKVVFKDYDPDEWLLSHCTIVASVDTEDGPGSLGKSIVDGFQIDRRFSNYLITPTTTKFVNNNHDAWDRPLLQQCYRTFVGGENYVEHLQIKEMSKGKIIDAAARDIGDSLYVDILVATQRKYRPLVAAISSGQLKTLSMGCTVTFTQCTRCGNVAEDESQLCPHIRYFKGSKFYDDFGKERKIAELCGHKSDPGSVKFIEASWVANPAFTGAVLRSILSAEDARKMASILSNGLNANNQDIDPGMIQKVATLMQSGQFLKVRGFELGGSLDTEGFKTAQDPFDFGTPDSGGGDQGGGEDKDKGKDKKDNANPLEKVVNDIADAIRERALEKVRGEIGKGEAAKLPKPAGELHENDSIIKSALRYPHWRGIARSVIAMTGDAAAAKKVLLGLIMYRSGGWKSIQASRSFTGKEVLAVSRVLDFATRRSSMAGEGRIYSVVVAVGGLGHFRNVAAYLSACRQAIGRDLTESESATLIAKGRLYALGTS